MELLETAADVLFSAALVMLGVWVIAATRRMGRMEENARNTAIAQRGTEGYATRRFSEVSKEIEKADESAKVARLLAFECSKAFLDVREALTDDGR